MRDLKARSLMMKPVISARRDTLARDVALQLISGLYSGMPVVDDDRKVVGVVTEFDLLQAVAEGKDLSKVTVQEVMTPGAVTADLETSASEIIKIMKEKNIIRLPVTQDGKLIGIIARCDILKTLVDPMVYVL